MKVVYSRFESLVPGIPDELRPMLKARVFGPSGIVRLDMLVDSGSDESIVPMRVLNAVGARYTGEQIQLDGIGGTQIGRVALARVEILHHTYEARLVGADTSRDLALLGQRDFFSRFVVTFDRPAGLFFVSRSSRTTA